MSIKLSKQTVSTFRGDVVTLQLKGDTDLSNAPIKWESSDNSIVSVREFCVGKCSVYRDGSYAAFNDGVLLTMLSVGSACITATLNGDNYSCKVNVREPKTASPDDKFNFYFGDFHSHSSSIHTRKEFLQRSDYFPRDVWKSVKEEGVFDSFVVSDHACLVDDKEFFDLFLDAENADTPDFITFPGVECEVVLKQDDAYGRTHKNAGEIVTFNTPGYRVTTSWDDFFEHTSGNPMAISGFAHPQVLGYDVYGMWNFSLEKNTTEQMLKRFKMIEMGNGRDEEDQVLLHETMYTRALDCGYHLAPVSTSDWHFPPWGASCLRGRTIVLSPEKSKEMFLDAVYNARLYATENGNVKLWYTVNGCIPAQTLPISDTYNFHVEISHFRSPLESEKTSIVEVISDYGKIVYSQSLTPSDSNILDFTIKSNTARFFYLRIFSTEGDRTWSPAVWTGREYDPCPEPPFKGAKIPKNKMSVVSCTPGADPLLLINDNPKEAWTSDSPNAEIIIDLGSLHDVCAIGYWPHEISRDNPDISEAQYGARFLSGYSYYVSADGKDYTSVGDGTMLCHGGEQLVRFKSQRARYVKLCLLGSAGSVSHKPRYAGAPVMIGEFDIYSVN